MTGVNRAVDCRRRPAGHCRAVCFIRCRACYYAGNALGRAMKDEQRMCVCVSVCDEHIIILRCEFDDALTCYRVRW